MYNPLIDKIPYGASVAKKETIMRFSVDCKFNIEKMFIVLRKDEISKRIEMPYEKTNDNKMIFVAKFTVEEWGIWHYRFEGEFANGIVFFGQSEDGTAINGDWLPEWQLTVIKHDYKTPEWAKGGIIYHIFADRFCKGEERPFLKEGWLHQNWNELPVVANDGEDYWANDFFGGNIAGIISKLDYIQSLGTKIIYLSPIFESFSNHRYDTGDYFKVDDLFGTNEQFEMLVKEAEKRGMEIMLDGVFNHTGSDSIYFNKRGNYNSLGAYQSKNSPYYDWFFFNEFPNKYDCWWGSTVVPTVNKQNKDYRKMVFGDNGVLKTWIRRGAKGWRLDVVDELPIDFVNEIRTAVKEEDENCLVLGEVWEDASLKVSYDEWRPYFFGDQLDGVTNYPFKEAILNFVVDKNVLNFKKQISSICQNYPKQSLDCLLNMLSSHDTVRAISRLSECEAPPTKRQRAEFQIPSDDYEKAKCRFKLASVIQFLLPGIPCLYYGDEAGVYGFEDPINRKTYPWGNEDKELLSFFEKLGTIHVRQSNILKGTVLFDKRNDLLVMTRKKDNEKITLVLNNDMVDKEFMVDEECGELWNEQMVNAGKIVLKPFSFLILKS